MKPRAKLVNQTKGRLPSAPSAPSAPGLRSNGSMSGQASNYGAAGSKPMATGALKGGGGQMAAKFGAFGTAKMTSGPLGAGKGKPQGPAGPGGGKNQPAGLVTDPQYWNNVMALNNQYGLEKTSALVDQQLADNAFTTESARMETDRARARRNLAESLLGSGAIYGGQHRREQTEGDQDYLLNRGRLGDDKYISDQQRIAEMADIESRLAPNVGTDWVEEAQAAQEREAERLAQQAAEGDPDYSLTVNQRIKGANKKIRRLRAKAAKIEDPAKRKAVRKRIQRVRKRRDRLVKKRDK